MNTEGEKLQEAQDFINQELQKQGVDRIDAMTWEQTPQDREAKIHRLVLFRGGEKSTFTFTQCELIKNDGSQQWKNKIRDHIGDILIEL